MQDIFKPRRQWLRELADVSFVAGCILGLIGSAAIITGLGIVAGLVS